MKDQKIMMHCIVNNVAYNEIIKQTQKTYEKKLGNINYIMIILYQNVNTNIKEYIEENEQSIDQMSNIHGLVYPITDKPISSKNKEYDYINLGNRLEDFVPENGTRASVHDKDLFNIMFKELPCIFVIDTKTKNAHKLKINTKLTKEELGHKFAYMFDVLNEKDFPTAIKLISLKNIWDNCKQVSFATITTLVSILISFWKIK